jgi:CheY-like chemotaxis protein
VPIRTRTVVSIVPDLLAASRIAGAARQLGVAHVAAKAADVLAACRSATADLVIVDLVGPGLPPAAIRALKTDPGTRSIPVVGFYPHVRNALRESALAAGAERALPRSAFFRMLPELLAGEAVPPDAAR